MKFNYISCNNKILVKRVALSYIFANLFCLWLHRKTAGFSDLLLQSVVISHIVCTGKLHAIFMKE